MCDDSKFVTKYIRIEFADPCIKAIDHADDIRKAVNHAAVNLAARHGVRLAIESTYTNVIIVRLDIPVAKIESFSIGNHLCGIARYLLRECSYPYRNHMMGRRLVYCIDAGVFEL